MEILRPVKPLVHLHNSHMSGFGNKAKLLMGYLIIDAKHKKVNLSQLLINLDMEDPVTGTTPKFGPNCRVFSSM